MSIFDSHSHLVDEKLYLEWENYLSDFVEKGGKGLINVGVDDSWNKKVIDLTYMIKAHSKFSDLVVASTIGYDPYQVYSGSLNPDLFNSKIVLLQELIQDNKKIINGIGETGIDLFYGKGDKNLNNQKQLFLMHCELAQDLGLAIVVHSRDSFDHTIEVLKKFNGLKIYFHCRGYGPDEINILNKEFDNYFVGFAGNITYPKADKLRDSLKAIDISRVVLETDAPYLAPQQVRGQINHPANLDYSYEFVSNLLKIDRNQLEQIVESNFMRLFFSEN